MSIELNWKSYVFYWVAITAMILIRIVVNSNSDEKRTASIFIGALITSIPVFPITHSILDHFFNEHIFYIEIASYVLFALTAGWLSLNIVCTALENDMEAGARLLCTASAVVFFAYSVIIAEDMNERTQSDTTTLTAICMAVAGIIQVIYSVVINTRRPRAGTT